ncbi:uncharacterized protein [Choristoneura fumiferana]|uniref:uncharacterized protein n=1 Tax=Choristoneura fumiferana TaxID=7141 RepID=UPI003D156472
MPRRGSDEQEPPRKRRRMIVYSDSEDSEQSDNDQQQNNDDNVGDNSQPPVATDTPDDLPKTQDQPMDSTPQQTEPSLEETLVELDAEFLAALGDPADDIPTYGEKIQQDLALRWLPLLCKGIPKDKKEILTKEHTIPENCKFLRAPTLNAEISAAISDIARARDKKLEINQNQLGLGISAVGKGLSLLLTNDDKHKKIQAIKSIADGCRILADLHYNETQGRIKLITPGLDKAFLHVIQDVKRDETLFGEKLSEKIKSSKTIEKQGLQIKKTPVPLKTTAGGATQSQPSTSRPRNQGNWSSASHYQSSKRGGRGRTYKYGATSRKPSSSTTTATSKPPSAAGSRPRATTQQ